MPTPSNTPDDSPPPHPAGGSLGAKHQNTAVVGLQWGDEGKGKIVDILSESHDLVVRYNGGANAGHTVVINGERYALHLLPSGILHPHTLSVIGNGVVFDPEQFMRERDGIAARGIEISRTNMRISNRAHVVMPWHFQLDAALENLLSGGDGIDHSIGTTKRGIGPAYGDKVNRATAIRVSDLLDESHLAERVRIAGHIKNTLLRTYDPAHESLDLDAIISRYATLGREIAPLVDDTAYLLHEANSAGRHILFEGANACLLDVDHGTYPYVTSSNCSTLGISTGTGLPARHVDHIVGIVKAYSTRVGAGPFPTELIDAAGERIRDRGHEYGTTTGRPRRCGWLDLVAVRYTAMICDVRSVAIMLFDVLADFDELKICTAYEVNGERTDRFLPDARLLAGAKPVYETLPGFADEITEARSLDDLPVNASRYLDRIAEVLGVPIEFVSVGPDRAQTIHCNQAG